MADNDNKTKDRGTAPKEGASPALIGGLVAAVVLALLIVANTRKTEVNFIVDKAEPPLWLLIVVTMIFTLIAERLVAFGWRRRKKRKEREQN
jgi:uncharacterized integral membrane protein